MIQNDDFIIQQDNPEVKERKKEKHKYQPKISVYQSSRRWIMLWAISANLNIDQFAVFLYIMFTAARTSYLSTLPPIDSSYRTNNIHSISPSLIAYLKGLNRFFFYSKYTLDRLLQLFISPPQYIYINFKYSFRLPKQSFYSSLYTTNNTTTFQLTYTLRSLPCPAAAHPLPPPSTSTPLPLPPTSDQNGSHTAPSQRDSFSSPTSPPALDQNCPARTSVLASSPFITLDRQVNTCIFGSLDECSQHRRHKLINYHQHRGLLQVQELQKLVQSIVPFTAIDLHYLPQKLVGFALCHIVSTLSI